jgi:hypothetical protein
MEYKLLVIGSSLDFRPVNKNVNAQCYIDFLRNYKKPLIIQTPASKESITSDKLHNYPICFHNGNILLSTDWDTCREVLVTTINRFEELLNILWCEECVIILNVTYSSKAKIKQVIKFVKDFLKTDLVTAKHTNEEDDIDLIFCINNRNWKGYNTYYTSLSAVLLILRYWEILFNKDDYINVDDTIKRCIDLVIHDNAKLFDENYLDWEYDEGRMTILFCLWLVLYSIDINFQAAFNCCGEESGINGPETLLKKADGITTALKYTTLAHREKFIELTGGPSKIFMSKLVKQSSHVAKQIEKAFMKDKENGN